MGLQKLLLVVLMLLKEFQGILCVTSAPSSAESVTEFTTLKTLLNSASNGDSIEVSFEDVTGTGPQSIKQIIWQDELTVKTGVDLTIYAYGVQLDGRDSVRIFSISRTATLTIYDGKLSGNASTSGDGSTYAQYGGGIFDNGGGSAVKLIDTDGRSCYAAYGGFAALTDNGGSGSDWTLEGGTFSSNFAAQRGGAFYLYASTLTATDLTITSNTADYGAGGGFFIGGGSTLTTLCYDFRNNEPESVLTSPVGTNTWNNYGTTCAPSSIPTTSLPSPHPTATPLPTPQPSLIPIPSPTSAPVEFIQPTEIPTLIPTTLDPSKAPTPFPTHSPTDDPTQSPTPEPTPLPTHSPTDDPTQSPTPEPTPLPTHSPTGDPTQSPTPEPTPLPTAAPIGPTSLPTAAPTIQPTVEPTPEPTPAPTKIPTFIPTTFPTSAPVAPTALPSPLPFSKPTLYPTPFPSTVPSPLPFSKPTLYPTPFPSTVPSPLPFSKPTLYPTPFPSTVPSPLPFSKPTLYPTPFPSTVPSPLPFSKPTLYPTPLPSTVPSPLPFSKPTLYPTPLPSTVPSPLPFSKPTLYPTPLPSTVPSPLPFSKPTLYPTPLPSTVPSPLPFSKPTLYPTPFPTTVPSPLPFSKPTLYPTPVPSTVPSPLPFSKPTSYPTFIPSAFPTAAPIAPSSVPTPLPIPSPSLTPSKIPTGLPSPLPVSKPSIDPTSAPSFIPTPLPVSSPSSTPSMIPTALPSLLPESKPTPIPTSLPTTSVPSSEPTFLPSDIPTPLPSTAEPSACPTIEPTAFPTDRPTFLPTALPLTAPTITPTDVPTLLPTHFPTVAPTANPTFLPTSFPSETPTSEPSMYPSEQPSPKPSILPSALPSPKPNPSPTELPSPIPSVEPSGRPSSLPSVMPIPQPTESPSILPVPLPTSTPSHIPTPKPSFEPTTSGPTEFPSPKPTRSPTTADPTLVPTKIPTSRPTFLPTRHPSQLPSNLPTMWPSSMPSMEPTSRPTSVPTVKPTSLPSTTPSALPTEAPTDVPTGSPTSTPTAQPSMEPTNVPSSLPTSIPSPIPSQEPSNTPTRMPTHIPTMTPSTMPSGLPTSTPSTAPTSLIPSAQPSEDLSTTTTPTQFPSPIIEGGLVIIDLEPTTLTPTTSDAWEIISGAEFSGVSADEAENDSEVFDTAIASLGDVRTDQISTEYLTVTTRIRRRRLDEDAEFHLVYTISGRGEFTSVENNIKSITTVSMTNAVQLAAIELGLESAFANLVTLGVDEVIVESPPTAMPTIVATSLTPTIPEKPTSSRPTVFPTTLEPTSLPSDMPTVSTRPTMLLEPSPQPTSPRPSLCPTSAPTILPTTSFPSNDPTATPTSLPTLLDCAEIQYMLPDTPTLISAQFSTHGGSVTLTFDTATDKGGKTSGEIFACSHLFDFPDVNQTTCSWSTDTECVASVDNALSLIPGTNASLLSGVLRAECDDSYRCECYETANSSSVIVSHSDTALIPTVVLSGASSLAACEDEAHISAHHSTGSGGRAFTYVWSIEITSNMTGTNNEIDAANAAIDAIVARANSENGNSILNLTSDEMIDLAIADAKQLNINLTLENFLQYQATSAISVKISDDDIPSVEIIGGNSQIVTRIDQLVVHAEGIATSCDGRELEDRGVDYEWTLYQDRAGFGLEDTGLVSTSNDARFFKLAAYTLESNSTYRVKTVVIDDYNGLNASAWTTIYVETSEITAVISGGNRQQTLNKSVILSAANSLDGDVEDLTGSAAGLSFEWSCAAGNNETSSVACASIEPIPNNETLKFDGNHLGAGTFIFTLIASATDGRYDTTESELTLIEESNPTVTIDSSSTSGTVANVERIVMYGSIDVDTIETDASSTMDTEWTLTKGDLSDDLSLSDWATTETFISGSVSDRTHNLVLSSGALISGATYTFRLEAYIEETGSVLGYAESSVYVATAPTGGSISISPASGGIAMETLFEVGTEGWVSDLEPLTYAYYATYKSNGNTVQTTLRESTRMTTLDRVYLPDGNITLSVVASDSYGSESEVSTNIYVAATSLDDDDLTNYTIESLEIAFEHHSDEEVCQIVISAASAAENNTDTLEVLINAMYLVVQDLDIEEDLISMAISALEAPCSYASSLSTSTAATALDTAQELAELSTQVGMSTDTATTLATTLSYLLTTDLFVSMNSTTASERRYRRRLEEDEDNDDVVASLTTTETGVLVNDTASNLLTSTVDSMCASTIWDAVAGERAQDVSSDYVNTAAQRLTANGTSRSLKLSASASSIDLPDSLDSDDDEYDVWIGEISINPYGAESNGTDVNSRIIRVGYASSDERRRQLSDNETSSSSSNTEIGVAIVSDEDVSETIDNLTVSLTCECGFEGNVSYTCPDGTLISKLCDGVPGTFNITCPSSTTNCQSWSGSLWTDQECTTVTTSSNLTKCVCKIKATEAESFSTKTSLLATLEAYEAGLTAKPNLSRALYMFITLGVLLILCIVLHTIGIFLDRRDRTILQGRSTELKYASKKKLDQKRIQRMYSADDVAYALNEVKTRHDMWTFAPRLSRFLRAVKYKHPFTNWYYYYSNDVSRIVRAWNLGFQILIFMFSFAVESNFSFPEHPGCDRADNEPDCAKYKAPNLAGGHHLCKWDICSQSCSVNEPDSDRSTDPHHYIMILIVLLFTIPFLKAYDYIFENFLIAPLPRQVHNFFGTKPRRKLDDDFSNDTSGGPPAAESSDGRDLDDEISALEPFSDKNKKKEFGYSRTNIQFGAPPSAEMNSGNDNEARIDFADEHYTSRNVSVESSHSSYDATADSAVVVIGDAVQEEARPIANEFSEFDFDYHEDRIPSEPPAVSYTATDDENEFPDDPISPKEEEFEEGVKLVEEKEEARPTTLHERPHLERSTSHLITHRPHLERSTTHELHLNDFDSALTLKQENNSHQGTSSETSYPAASSNQEQSYYRPPTPLPISDGVDDGSGSVDENSVPPSTGKIHPGTLFETSSGRTVMRSRKAKKNDPIQIAMKESLRKSTLRRRIKVRCSLLTRNIKSMWRWSTTKGAQYMDRRKNEINASSADIHRARQLAPEVVHIVTSQCLEVRELMTLVEDRDDDLGRTAYLHLERLYDGPLRRWDWVPNYHLFEQNVATILGKQLALAEKWQEELRSLKKRCIDKDTYIDRADAVLVEYEQVSRMNDFERHICNICTDRMASMVSAAPDEPAQFWKWLSAWFVLFIIVGIVTYYLILTASNMGRSRSKLWLVSLIASFVLVYGVAVPCEIFFFEGWMPDLVVHRLKTQKPGVMRKFPFRSGDTPYAVTFLLELEPELQQTRLAKYLSHRQEKQRAEFDQVKDIAIYVEENIADIPEICKHETWLPTIDTRLLIFVVGLFTLLPDDLQETIFEEAVGATPIIPARHLPVWLRGGRHGNSDFVTAILVICAFFIMAFFYIFIESSRIIFRRLYDFLFEDAAVRDKDNID